MQRQQQCIWEVGYTDRIYQLIHATPFRIFNRRLLATYGRSIVRKKYRIKRTER